MTPEYLKIQAGKLPDGPGVYLYKDAKGTPVYIGKASNLKSRVSSYLKATDPRIKRMIEVAKRLEIQETASDIEALILESQLIKKHRPAYNIVMRDDKQYFFVAFTDEPFPKIFLTHQIKNNKIKAPIGELIGPFTDGAALKSTIKLLRRLFPYCTCKKAHHVRCLNAHIGKCLGICCLKQPDEISNFKFSILKYRENIKAIKAILNGRKSSLVADLKKEMDALARDDKFEKAIELRGKIERLEKIFHNAQIIRTAKSMNNALKDLQKDLKMLEMPIRIEGYDISNIQGEHATGSMVTFVNGHPDKNFYRKFKIKTVHGANDVAMLTEMLTRRFYHTEWEFPQLIIIDGGKGQLNATLAVLAEFELDIPIVALTKNEMHQGDHLFVNTVKNMIPLSALAQASKNLILGVDAEAHRFAISYYRHLHGKKFKTP